MSLFPISHKTVFVLDRSPYFTQSCNQPIEYDVLSRSKGSGIIPAAPITKSLWTCCIEALQEYLRIVMDIYPREKQIRVVTGSSSMNQWNCTDMISTILTKLSLVGPPKKEDYDFSILHDLSAAVNSLREPTMQQLQKMEGTGQAVKNRGRIILLTNIKNQSQMEKIEGFVQKEITQLNMTDSTDFCICDFALLLLQSVPNPSSYCSILFINLAPRGRQNPKVFALRIEMFRDNEKKVEKILRPALSVQQVCPCKLNKQVGGGVLVESHKNPVLVSQKHRGYLVMPHAWKFTAICESHKRSVCAEETGWQLQMSCWRQKNTFSCWNCLYMVRISGRAPLASSKIFLGDDQRARVEVAELKS
ncbi:hypothetical protein RRG08_049481 [Elysia crispata]|uniref:Protein asunder n=1 Tax=Elysia crispata TaxID=231223 RepID=A0AAE0ZS18_9GAST|nr:hypothetical protein RRG08_049481 [Elysia crispata]